MFVIPDCSSADPISNSMGGSIPMIHRPMHLSRTQEEKV